MISSMTRYIKQGYVVYYDTWNMDMDVGTDIDGTRNSALYITWNMDMDVGTDIDMNSYIYQQYSDSMLV